MDNFPTGDIWRLDDSDRNSQNYRQSYKFDFSFFESEEIKAVVKKYIWTNYRTGNRVPKGLRESLWRFKFFDRFCRQNDVRSLRDFDNGLADDYRSSLRVYLSPSTGKLLSYAYQRACFSTLRAVIDWCRVFMPEAVPEKQTFTGNEYRQAYGKLTIDFIPDKILQAVNEALVNEDNPYLRYGIAILECTGMRVGDLLLLTTGCVSEHPISGNTISWFDHKNRKHRNGLPVPRECKEAVDALIQVTDEIRKRADDIERERLFIYEPALGANKKPIVTVSKQVFVKWCGGFSKKHDIRDSGGSIYRIASHMFRRTLATDMLSKGTNIKVIQEVLGHVSPAITKKYYADVKDAESAEMFLSIGILGDVRQVSDTNVSDQEELVWFRDNCAEKARLSDGYCTLPIHDGKPCAHFLSRQKCYLCSRYITTLDDLETHRSHLAELQEMLEANIYGEHYTVHIVPTVIALKEIVRRLEVLQNEQ